MAFSKIKGRPRTKIAANQDLGTKQLRSKYYADLTIEPIDLLLKKGLITQEQHEAAMRFRWLYNLQYGALTLRSYDLEFQGGSSTELDPVWRQSKAKEFQKAAGVLASIRGINLIYNLCVFNQWPACLTQKMSKTNLNQLIYRSDQANSELSLIKEALELLVKLFNRSRGYGSKQRAS